MCVMEFVSKPGPHSRGVWESLGNLEMNGNGWGSSLSKRVEPSKSRDVIMLGLECAFIFTWGCDQSDTQSSASPALEKYNGFTPQ